MVICMLMAEEEVLTSVSNSTIGDCLPLDLASHLRKARWPKYLRESLVLLMQLRSILTILWMGSIVMYKPQIPKTSVMAL